jgi:cytochrome c oxidase cbb3-type subunit 1
VAQSVIDWWFSNNLLFVWLGLVGLGVAFYLISKISGRPLQRHYFAAFAFWSFILFAPWCGIPQGAPVPSWLPSASAVASFLTLIPLISVAIVFFRSICGVNVVCKGGPYCYAKFATVAFLLSALMYLATGCSHFSSIVGMTWYMPAQMYLQIFGFFTVAICGAIYEALPGVMDFELPFRGFVRAGHWMLMLGLLFLVLPLAIGGIGEGLKMRNPNIPFHDISQGTLIYLKVATLGLCFLLLSSLMLAANIFTMTATWKLKLVKSFLAVFASWNAETPEVKS